MKYLIKLCDKYYKLAAEQLKFPFMENEKPNSSTTKTYSDEEIEEIEYQFQEYINSYESITFEQLNNYFIDLGITFTKCPPNSDKPFGIKFEYNGEDYIITIDSWPLNKNDIVDEPQKLNNFIQNLSMHQDLIDKYSGIDEDKFNDEFWSGPSALYHATQKSYLQQIKKYGLNPSSKIRGISNRFVGDAVFCSTDPERVLDYGDTILEIDMNKMKSDGIMPKVGLEPDIEEAEKLEAIAHACGITDYSYEVEAAMDPETIIVYGGIPAKYIKIQDTGENLLDLTLENDTQDEEEEYED